MNGLMVQFEYFEQVEGFYFQKVFRDSFSLFLSRVQLVLVRACSIAYRMGSKKITKQ